MANHSVYYWLTRARVRLIFNAQMSCDLLLPERTVYVRIATSMEQKYLS